MKVTKDVLKVKTHFTKTRGIGRVYYHDILLKNCKVGDIQIAKEFFRIRLKVTEESVKWKWIMLLKEFNTIEEIKVFLKDYSKEILEKYTIYIDESN